MSLGPLDHLSRWSRYRPSLCKGCWAGCCRLPVEVTLEDLTRLGVVSPDETNGSLKKLTRKLHSEGTIKHFRSTTGLFTLTQKSDGTCLFLGSDARCTVYENRPQVCRHFPEIGPRPGFCPARPQRPTSSQSLNRGP